MKAIILVSIVVFLVGCVSSSSSSRSTKPVQSEYLLTDGGGFIVGGGKLMYAMNYKILKQLPQGAYLAVSFENPVNKSQPLLKEVKPKSEVISVRSESLPSIKNNTVYQVVVEILHQGNVVSSHTQNVNFSMPSGLLNKLGIQEL